MHINDRSTSLYLHTRVLCTLFIKIKFMKIFRLRITEICDKFKNNARLKLHQDLENFCVFEL